MNDDSQSDRPYLLRVKVDIPEVYGAVTDIELLPWAWPGMPCFGGPAVNTAEGVAKDLDSASKKPTPPDQPLPEYVTHGMFAVPPVGATVWVLFEQGDPQVPVYFGSWINAQTHIAKSLQPVLPSPANSQSSEPPEPPPPAYFLQRFTIKSPYRRNMYLNFNGPDSIEIVFGDTVVRLSSFDDGSFWGDSNQETTKQVGQIGKVEVRTARSNIYLDSENGNVVLRGRKVKIQGYETLDLVAGEWGAEGDDQACILRKGRLTVSSTYEAKLFADRIGKIQGRGEWSIAVPNVSGFEKHVGNKVDPTAWCAKVYPLIVPFASLSVELQTWYSKWVVFAIQTVDSGILAPADATELSVLAGNVNGWMLSSLTQKQLDKLKRDWQTIEQGVDVIPPPPPQETA